MTAQSAQESLHWIRLPRPNHAQHRPNQPESLKILHRAEAAFTG
jgi:hypothetical protein